MAEARAAWGIDIGQSALKAIKVRYDESAGQIVAEQFDYIAFPKILSQPDAIPEEIVPQAMETFLARNDLKGDLVAISVPGQSALARFISLPPVESSKLHEIVKYEARQQIPFALEEVIWDYQPLGAGVEEGGFLLEAEVGLFAMKRDQIARQLQPYNDAKVEVELIQIAPLALYNLLSVDELGIRSDTEGEAGDEHFILLDMGCDNTTLLVSNGYNVWIRNVPIGGNHFTRALTKEMKLSFAKAEHLKCNATKSPDPRAVFQALRPVFNDYVSEIQRSIGYFSSVNRQAKIGKVIGLGNGFKLAGLQKFLQQNLQYQVERPDSFRGLAGDAVLNSPLMADNILSFAVPYGLSLQALGLSRIRTSLLPPEIKAARRIRRKKPWAVATAAALLLGFTVSTVGNAFSYQAVNTPAFAAAEKEADDFGGEISQLASAYGAQTGRFTAAEERLHSLVDGRRDVSWMEVFNAITDCLPRDEEGVEYGPDDIEKRHRISLSEISSDKVPDLATWFSGLSKGAKLFMPREEQEAGPSGAGYVFTIRGKHWHHNPDNHREQRESYINYFFIKNLQQPKIQRPGFPERDVKRLGISHVAMPHVGTETLKFAGQQKPDTKGGSRLNTRPGGGLPMAPGGYSGEEGYDDGGDMYGTGYPGGAGGGYPGGGMYPGAGGAVPPGVDPDKVKEIFETSFVLQFAFQYVPPDQRDSPPEDLAGDAGDTTEEEPVEE